MWDFLFEDIESGEWFFVECNNLEEAQVILEMSGFQPNEIKFYGKYTTDEADILGYDTY